MSYSRFSNSKWYVYWNAALSGDTQESQMITIQGDAMLEAINFSYSQLADETDECLEELWDSFEISPDDLDELGGYFQEFLNDVNEEF